MEHLFDSALKNTTHLRHHLKKISKDKKVPFRRLLKDVLTQLDGDLGKVWMRRRRIRRVLDKYGVNDQRSTQWHSKRGEMLTASEITKAFKSATPLARYDLMMKKIVNPPRPTGGEDKPKALIWGTQFEPVAKQLYETFNGVRIVDTSCVRHPKYAFLGASPDGIVLPENPLDSRWGMLVEFKCPMTRVYKPESPVPDYYWHQMQLQMEVCDIDVCDYVEFRFQALSYSEWIKSVAEHKGIYVCFEDDSVEYKPSSTDHKEWLQKVVIPRKMEYQTTYWLLANWRSVLVQRDYGWMPRYYDELKAFWDEVLEHRANGTLPVSPTPVGTLTLDMNTPCLPDGASSVPESASLPPGPV
jgi:putative phage-type endonuclease